MSDGIVCSIISMDNGLTVVDQTVKIISKQILGAMCTLSQKLSCKKDIKLSQVSLYHKQKFFNQIISTHVIPTISTNKEKTERCHGLL